MRCKPLVLKRDMLFSMILSRLCYLLFKHLLLLFPLSLHTSFSTPPNTLRLHGNTNSSLLSSHLFATCSFMDMVSLHLHASLYREGMLPSSWQCPMFCRVWEVSCGFLCYSFVGRLLVSDMKVGANTFFLVLS